MDYFMRIDVSETDENGNPVVERFDIPDELVTARVWDVAYDAATQTFSGVVRPNTKEAMARSSSWTSQAASPRLS